MTRADLISAMEEHAASASHRHPLMPLRPSSGTLTVKFKGRGDSQDFEAGDVMVALPEEPSDIEWFDDEARCVLRLRATSVAFLRNGDDLTIIAEANEPFMRALLP